MSVRISLNTSGMKQLLLDQGIAGDLQRRAERVAAAARATAPVQTGEYRNSIFSTMGRTDRVVARVGARAGHGLIVEANTGNLSRSLDAAGGS